MAYEPRDTSNTEKEIITTNTTIVPAHETSGAMVGIVGILVVVALVVAGYLFYANKQGKPVFSSSTATSAAGAAVSSTNDVAAEVPQAIRDATAEGDQNTTRPNKDETTNQLDQKSVVTQVPKNDTINQVEKK